MPNLNLYIVEWLIKVLTNYRLNSKIYSDDFKSLDEWLRHIDAIIMHLKEYYVSTQECTRDYEPKYYNEVSAKFKNEYIDVYREGALPSDEITINYLRRQNDIREEGVSALEEGLAQLARYLSYIKF